MSFSRLELKAMNYEQIRSKSVVQMSTKPTINFTRKKDQYKYTVDIHTLITNYNEHVREEKIKRQRDGK